VPEVGPLFVTEAPPLPAALLVAVVPPVEVVLVVALVDALAPPVVEIGVAASLAFWFEPQAVRTYVVVTAITAAAHGRSAYLSRYCITVGFTALDSNVPVIVDAALIVILTLLLKSLLSISILAPFSLNGSRV
jgi:hypothetical protein